MRSARSWRIVAILVALCGATLLFVFGSGPSRSTTIEGVPAQPDRIEAIPLEGLGNGSALSDDPPPGSDDAQIVRVVDASDSTPIAQASIVQVIEAGPSVVARTDEKGEAGVPRRPGTWVATAPGYAAKRMVWKVDVENSSSVIVFELDSLEYLEGVVFDPRGVVAADVTVAIVPINVGFRDWSGAVEGVDGFWNEGLTARAFRVRTDSEGRFRIPRPQTRAMLRVSSQVAVWVADTDQQLFATELPSGGEYHLRQLVSVSIRFRDDETGELVNVEQFHAGSEPRLDPLFPAMLADPLPPPPDGIAFVRGVLPDSAERLSVGVSGWPWKYGRFEASFDVDLLDASRVFEVALTPIPRSYGGTIRLVLPDSANVTDGVLQSAIVEVSRQGIPIDFGRQRLTLGPDERSVDVWAPAGEYRAAPPPHDRLIVRDDGRHEVIINWFREERVHVAPGEVSEFVIPLETKGLVQFEMAWPPGGRPAQLDVHPLSGSASPAFKHWTFAPAPDVLSVYLARTVDGTIRLSSSGMQPQEVELRMPPPHIKTVRVEWNELR